MTTLKQRLSRLNTILVFIALITSCKNEEYPQVITSAPTNIAGTTAAAGGEVISEGTGTVAVRGICWGTGSNPTITDNCTTDGRGIGVYTSNMTGLEGATPYYFRSYATSEVGTGYGAVILFTTLGTVPAVSPDEVTYLTSTSVSLAGKVNANYLPTTVTFEYGTTTSYESSIVAEQSPVTGNDTVNVTAVVEGLNVSITYHFRIKAVNALGTVYSDDMTFSTMLQDREGNLYSIITIGNQSWMKENLRSTIRNDGTPIENIVDPSEWAETTLPGWCYYNNDAAYKNPYGMIYNWYAIKTEHLCPEGWHVPTMEDWTALMEYLGGAAEAGGKLKEQGTTHWNSPNSDATNVSQFTGLPGGYRSNSNGAFFGLGDDSSWWSSSPNGIYSAWVVAITLYNTTAVQTVSGYLNYGESVRCIQNQ